MPDGSQVHFEHAEVDTRKETLEVLKSLVGDSKASLYTMKKRQTGG